MDTIAGVFTFLAIFLALPLAIVDLSFASRIRNAAKGFAIFLGVAALGLVIGAFVNGIVGAAESRSIYSWDYYYGYSDYYYYRHPCCWVCLGLSCGAMLVLAVDTVITFVTLGVQRKNRRAAAQANIQRENVAVQQLVQNKPAEVAKTTGDMSYIEEIKALKNLLDIGAITQEEFDKKKRELLN